MDQQTKAATGTGAGAAQRNTQPQHSRKAELAQCEKALLYVIEALQAAQAELGGGDA